VEVTDRQPQDLGKGMPNGPALSSKRVVLLRSVSLGTARPCEDRTRYAGEVCSSDS
jgi:hypothetical protein